MISPDVPGSNVSIIVRTSFGVDVCPQRRIVHAPDVPERNGKQAEHQRAESHVHQRQAGRGEAKEADHVEFSIPSYSRASVRGFLHAAFKPVKAGTPTPEPGSWSRSDCRRPAYERRSRVDWSPRARDGWHPGD